MADNRCVTCGICLERCPTERAGGRTILTRLVGGEGGSAWLCAACWKCQAACPAGIDIHELMIHARQTEPPPPAYAGSYQNVLKTGYVLPLPPDLDAARNAHHLPAAELISVTTLRQLLGDEEDSDDS